MLTSGATPRILTHLEDVLRGAMTREEEDRRSERIDTIGQYCLVCGEIELADNEEGHLNLSTRTLIISINK